MSTTTMRGRVLPIALSGQMVDNGGRGDSLAGSWRPLDQTEGSLQYRFHSINLYCAKTT